MLVYATLAKHMQLKKQKEVEDEKEEDEEEEEEGQLDPNADFVLPLSM